MIVLSAYGDIKLVKSCFKSGADGYLLKTSNSGSLINASIQLCRIGFSWVRI